MSILLDRARRGLTATTGQTYRFQIVLNTPESALGREVVLGELDAHGTDFPSAMWNAEQQARRDPRFASQSVRIGLHVKRCPRGPHKHIN